MIEDVFGEVTVPYSQDKSYNGLERKPKGVSLAGLLQTTPTQQQQQEQPPITKYTKSRIRNSKTVWTDDKRQTTADNETVKQDPAIRLYLADLAQSRGNNGILAEKSKTDTYRAVRAFLHYASLEITPDAMQKLVTYKQNNPASRNIELALKTFSLEDSVKFHSSQATRIQGIFHRNFAQLAIKVNTHYAPTEENCTLGIFLEIYTHLTQEQKDMIQWALYVPERAKAAYRVPLTNIDISRQDYAIVKIAGAIPNANGIRSKMRVDHPCLPPIDFAKRIVANAKAAGNNCPFPTHEWLWKQITAFALKEYKVRLISNYTRKLFESVAKHSTLLPSIAAFIMGDKTKLAATGHLPLIYDPELRPMEREQFIQDYHSSGITQRLTISTNNGIAKLGNST